MKTRGGLYPGVYAFANLHAAFLKASKQNTGSPEALEFEYYLERDLFRLQRELQSSAYTPRVPRRKVVHDPARRVISCPAFRDRIVQHALMRVLRPVFERSFIHDSYAFRAGKGTHAALRRYDRFKVKISPRRFPGAGFVLKADIRNYYPSVDHERLVSILERKLSDGRLICLVRKFLEKYSANGKGICVGSPLSQLFANIYLNELDHHVKEVLRERCYLRYCDDIFVLKRRRKPLEEVKARMASFLESRLALELNDDKTKIIPSNGGVDVLGYKSFYFFKLLRKRNVRAFKARLDRWRACAEENGSVPQDAARSIRGWCEYARYADSYKLRKKLLSRPMYAPRGERESSRVRGEKVISEEGLVNPT